MLRLTVALAPPPAAPCPGPRPNPPGGPGRPGGPLRATVSPGTASGSSGPGLRPALPAVLDALAARCGSRKDTGQEAAAPWTLAPARRSTRCGPRWALAPPPAAPGPGTRPDLPAILDTLMARTSRQKGTDQGGSRTPDAATGPEIHTLRATVGPCHRLRRLRALGHGPTSRRSWTPWRLAVARGRTPLRGQPRPGHRHRPGDPHAAGHSGLLAPPPAASGPGTRPDLPAVLDALTARTSSRKDAGQGGGHGGPWHCLRQLPGPGPQPDLAGGPGRPGGPLRLAGGYRPGRQPHPGGRHRAEDPHAAGHGGRCHRLRQLRPLDHGPALPAILDALAAIRISIEGTAQGDSRTTDAGTGPEIHALRLTVGPGTASGGSGPWITAQPSRRSWTPWRAAPAGGRTPTREAAAPRTPAPARRSTRCGSRWALAPPPAAPGPGTRPDPAGDPGPPGGPHQLAGGHRPGRQPHHGRRHRPGDHTLRATAGHGTAPGSSVPWTTARPRRRSWTPWRAAPTGRRAPPRATAAPRTPAQARRSTRCGSRWAPGTASGGSVPWTTASPFRRSWTPWRAAPTGGRAPPREASAPWTPAQARRSTRCGSRWAPGTASGGSGPWTTASPPGDPGHPGGQRQPAGERRPGRQPRPGRRQRPGGLHAATHGGPLPPSPAALDLGHGQPSRRSWTP